MGFLLIKQINLVGCERKTDAEGCGYFHLRCTLCNVNAIKLLKLNVRCCFFFNSVKGIKIA